MRPRFVSLSATLLGTAALTLLPGLAEAKPTCHGKKATVVLGGGNNKYVAPHQGHGNQVVIAGAGDDYIVTGKGSDVICAGDGNDRILGGRGTDHVYGGARAARHGKNKGKGTRIRRGGHNPPP